MALKSEPDARQRAAHRRRDPALRRRSNAGLNKGEAKHALAKAVFFHRLGEIRDRTFENQRYRASGLNLAVAAITLWNTVYLGRAVDQLRSQGEVIDDALLGGNTRSRKRCIAVNASSPCVNILGKK